MAHRACRACPLAFLQALTSSPRPRLPGWPHPLLLRAQRGALPRSPHCPPRTALPVHLNPISAQRSETLLPALTAVCALYLHSICLLTVRRQFSVVSHFCTCCKPGTHCPSFFLHDLLKNVCAAKSLGDKESIFLWSKGRHISWPL